MSEQVGWRGFFKSLRVEAPNYAAVLPQLPRLLHRYLADDADRHNDAILQQILQMQQRYNTLLGLVGALLLCLVAWEIFSFYGG